MKSDSQKWRTVNWVFSWSIPVVISPVIASILTPPDLITLILATLFALPVCLMVFQLLRLLNWFPAIYVCVALLVSFLGVWGVLHLAKFFPDREGIAETQMEPDNARHFDLSTNERSLFIDRVKRISD